MQGAPGLSIPERGAKESAGSGSFGAVLGEKLSKAPDKEVQREAPKSQDRSLKEKKSESGETERRPREKKATENSKEPEAKESDSAKPNSRKVAIKKFMDSIESELGVSSTRLVEAIANLNPAEQLKSPEESAESVIAELGLDENSEDKAMGLYAGLLAELKAMPVPAAEITSGTAAPLAKATEAPPVVNTLDLKNLLSSDSASVLNDEAAAAMAELNSASAPTQELTPEMLSKLLDAQKDVNGDGGSELDAEMPNALSADELLPTPESAMQGAQKLAVKAPAKPVVEDLSPLALAALVQRQQVLQKQSSGEDQAPEADLAMLGIPNAEGEGLTEAKLKNQMEALAGKDINAKGEVSLQLRQLMDQFRQQGQSQQNSFGGSELSAQEATGAAGGKTDAQVTEFRSTLDSLSPHLTPIKSEAVRIEIPLAAATSPGMQPNAEQSEANIKQILSQAQILIKKGGGEMNVRMTPEGLGEVHMKVLMQDGKMNLQLNADSKEAKQAIESSLAELKTSLAAHKLSVDHIKVDVVNSTNTENSTNRQMDMNSQQGQDQAKKFWNQFQENFGSNARRESFFSSPSNVGYGTKKVTPLQPIENVSPTSSSRQVQGRGAGLNLVA